MRTGSSILARRKGIPGKLVLRKLMKRLPRVLALLLIFASLPAVATDKAKAFYKQGLDAEVRGDYETAYNDYHQAYQLKPDDIQYRASFERVRFLASAAHVHKGELLQKAGKLQEALTEFEQAMAIDPSSFIAQQEVNKISRELRASRTNLRQPTPSSTAQSALHKRMEEAGGPVELATIANTPITLKMSADSKTIYETIGKLAGINVLFDPDYTSRGIRVELNGVTLQEALEIAALESKTFWRPVTPNTIFVAADTPAKRKELEQSVIRTFYLTNLSQPNELQDLVNILRTLLDTQRLQQFPSQQAIVVRGTPDQIALAEKLIDDLDKSRPEVVVDVVIMQVQRNKLRDLGITPPTNVSVALIDNTTSSTTTSGTNVGTGNGSATTTTGSTAGTINLNSLAHINATNFQVTIPPATASFLYNDSTTKILQQPQIRALDGQKASLKIGQRVPVATGFVPAGNRRSRHQPAGQYAVQLHRCRREYRRDAAGAWHRRSDTEARHGHLGGRFVPEHRRNSAAGDRTTQDRARDPHARGRSQHHGRNPGGDGEQVDQRNSRDWPRSRSSDISSPQRTSSGRTTNWYSC